MDDAKRARLEAAGFRMGTVQEFLGLTDAQNARIEARLRLAAAVKAARLSAGMTQSEAAARLAVSQPYIVRLESGSPKATLDAMIQALLEYGANLETIGSVLASPAPGASVGAAPVAAAIEAPTPRRRRRTLTYNGHNGSASAATTAAEQTANTA